jgi:hypothetical protein
MKRQGKAAKATILLYLKQEVPAKVIYEKKESQNEILFLDNKSYSLYTCYAFPIYYF